jgi:hypothetical protein
LVVLFFTTFLSGVVADFTTSDVDEFPAVAELFPPLRTKVFSTGRLLESMFASISPCSAASLSKACFNLLLVSPIACSAALSD